VLGVVTKFILANAYAVQKYIYDVKASNKATILYLILFSNLLYSLERTTRWRGPVSETRGNLSYCVQRYQIHGYPNSLIQELYKELIIPNNINFNSIQIETENEIHPLLCIRRFSHGSSIPPDGSTSTSRPGFGKHFCGSSCPWW
jgi:hypothetical protein